MQSFYFGEASRQLYGVIQEPAGNHFADYAVLMCYPFGQEQMRCHRAFRQLGSMFARHGVASLRFDYFGSGDSAGDSADFSLSESIDNCQQALEQLKKMAAVERIYVVGLRLGAFIAAKALAANASVKGFVCWDAVLSGGRYLSELRATISDEQADQLILNDSWWVNGFALLPALRAEIAQLEFEAIEFAGYRDILQVVSSQDSQYEQFAQHLRAQGHRVAEAYTPIEGGDNWQLVDDQGSLLLPHQSLKAVVDHVIDWQR